MKTVLALFSALMLIGAQTLALGQPAPAGAGTKAGTSCHCARACCSAAQSAGQPAAPAVPTPSGFQSQLLTPTSASLVWVLPQALVDDGAFSKILSLTVSGAPLYGRDCARLL